MRRSTRFAVGVALGGGALAGYLHLVGVADVSRRVTSVAPWAVAAVVALVVGEHLVDALGVWASVEPLGEGLSAGESVQFALAGDFFDVLSPAGPVSSEPIVARFVAVTTGTTYGEALAVRSVAKYVKAGTQLLVSTGLAVALFAAGTTPPAVAATLGAAVVALLIAAGALLWLRPAVSRAAVALLTPVVARVATLWGGSSDHESVAAGVERFWTRLLAFRGRPRLLALVAVAGVAEQLLTAGALWVALAANDAPVLLLPIVAVIPLPQAASVVPVPASLGTYDVLLSGSLVLVTGVPAAAATAAVLVVRTVAVPVSVGSGGVAVALLRGWRPRRAVR